ncbi:hypothetical protein D3C76_1643660 [compost metagenome]
MFLRDKLGAFNKGVTEDSEIDHRRLKCPGAIPAFGIKCPQVFMNASQAFIKFGGAVASKTGKGQRMKNNGNARTGYQLAAGNVVDTVRHGITPLITSRRH